MPRGGKRDGQRPPTGKHWKWASTLAKEEAREVARQQITASLGRIIEAQTKHAIGIGHLYIRDAKGKYKRIEDLAAIDHLITTGTEGKDFYIYAKDPSTEAAKALMDRALDRPKEQPQELAITLNIKDRKDRLRKAQAQPSHG